MNERLGGDPDWPPHMDDLNECCYETCIEDLKLVGFHLTWDNRSSADSFTSRKLDQVMVNPTWLSHFPLSEALFLPPRTSDHCLMTVNIGINLHKRKPTFRFYNIWAEHAELKVLFKVFGLLMLLAHRCIKSAKSLK